MAADLDRCEALRHGACCVEQSATLVLGQPTLNRSRYLPNVFKVLRHVRNLVGMIAKSRCALGPRSGPHDQRVEPSERRHVGVLFDGSGLLEIGTLARSESAMARSDSPLERMTSLDLFFLRCVDGSGLLPDREPPDSMVETFLNMQKDFSRVGVEGPLLITGCSRRRHQAAAASTPFATTRSPPPCRQLISANRSLHGRQQIAPSSF